PNAAIADTADRSRQVGHGAHAIRSGPDAIRCEEQAIKQRRTEPCGAGGLHVERISSENFLSSLAHCCRTIAQPAVPLAEDWPHAQLAFGGSGAPAKIETEWLQFDGHEVDLFR